MASAVERDQPRHFLPLRWRRSNGSVPDQRLVGQSTPDNGAQYGDESPCVSHLARVEAKCLLVKIPEKMEGLNAHIGTLDAPLEQRS